MATKKSLGKSVPDPTGSGDYAKENIEERRRRRTEAATVDGSESYPPPGMDLPDGGQVPLDDGPEDVTDTAKDAQKVQDKTSQASKQ
jgi:hypothetical protein